MFLIPFMPHLLLDLKLVVEDALDPESHGNGKTEGRREGLQFGELLCLRWGWARSSHIYKHGKLQLLHRRQMRRKPRAAIWEPRSTWQVKYVYMGESETQMFRGNEAAGISSALESVFLFPTTLKSVVADNIKILHSYIILQ